jgi:hypothetical protein
MMRYSIQEFSAEDETSDPARMRRSARSRYPLSPNAQHQGATRSAVRCMLLLSRGSAGFQARGSIIGTMTQRSHRPY